MLNPDHFVIFFNFSFPGFGDEHHIYDRRGKERRKEEMR
jgi:hypothetical protein